MQQENILQNDITETQKDIEAGSLHLWIQAFPILV